MKIEGTDISMIRGDSESLTISCSNEKGEKIPFVAGDIVYLTVKKSAINVEKAFQIVVTAFTEDGNAIMAIHHNDTKDLSFGIYVYDVQLSKLDGTVKTLIPLSKFVLEKEVTHD